ncbi:MAG: prepilin-type N-terminal cleavage/methylation domain-containing protein [Gammaproteobacteria bacterium]|nr:prepilin-type N-terminal cleavage/methylation domain-containing protein [Gammaproteobacteria bacterium]
MRRNHKATTQTGFSLLEVLITLVVLGAGLISLAKFQGTVLQDNDLAKARSVAAQLAEEKIEQFRSFRFLDTATGGAGSYESISSNPTGESLAVSNVTYARTWTVTDFCFPIARNSPGEPNNPPQRASLGGCRRPIPDFKNVTVKVEWTDQDGKPRDVRLYTSIAAVDPAYSGRVTQINAQRPATWPNELYF